MVSPGSQMELPLLVVARGKNIPVIGEMELADQLTPKMIGIDRHHAKSDHHLHAGPDNAGRRN